MLSKARAALTLIALLVGILPAGAVAAEPTTALGLPSVGVPIVNYDNNQHGPDENLRLGNFFQGIDIFASMFLWE